MVVDVDLDPDGTPEPLRVVAMLGEGPFVAAALALLATHYTLELSRLASSDALRDWLADRDCDLVLYDPAHVESRALFSTLDALQRDVPAIALRERWEGDQKADALRAGARAAPDAALLELLPAIIARERAILQRHRETLGAVRLRASLALSESEALFRATFEQAAVGMSHVAPDGRWLRVNQRFCDIVGYSREELLALHFQDITHPGDVDVDVTNVGKMLAREIDRFAMEKRYLHKNGAAVWTNLTVSLVWKHDGEPDYFICVVEDIRARKAAETALRRRESELRLLMDHVPAMIAYIDPDYRYRYANRAYIDLFGDGAVRSLVGLRLEDVVNPFNRPRVRENVRRALQGETLHLESGRLHRDGRMRNLDVHLLPHHDGDGNGAVQGVFALINDVTERVEHERVRIERARLEAANAELNAFAYNAAHDLRAPLRAISGFAALLRESDAKQLSESGAHALMRIEGSAQRLHELVEALLNYARSAQQHLSVVPLNLRQLASEAVETLSNDWPAATVEVRALPEAHGDRELIWDVLLNLIGNALKFSSKVPRPRVEIGACDTDQGKAVYIRDNGAGFDPKYAEKLFGVFQRLHSESEFPGTGIGLAFAQRVLARHGSEIWAESTPGQGAVFYFTPPQAPAA